MADSFILRPDGFYHIDKDPSSELIYTADVRPWLTDSGSLGLATAEVTVEEGMSKIGTAGISDGRISQMLTGGTVGQAYEAVWRFSTLENPAQVDERTAVIHVKSR